MAMYYNGKKVRNLYYNGKCITRLALGKEMTRLVEGDDFVMAQWLVGDGTAYIDTLITSYSGFVKIGFDVRNSIGARIVGRERTDTSQSDYSERFVVQYQSNGLWIYGVNAVILLSDKKNEITIDIANDIVTGNDGASVQGIGLVANKTGMSLFLFADHRSYGATDFYSGAISKFEISSIIDLVPCRLLRPIPATLDGNGIARNADECGMYDAVSGKFYGNVANSGTFSVEGMIEGVDYEVHDKLIMHGTSGGYGANMKFAESPISLSEKIMRVNIGLNRIFIICTSPHYYLAIYSYGSSGLFIVRQWAASDPNNVIFFQQTHIDGQELVVNFSTGKMQYGEYEGNIISNETYTVQASQNYYESPHNSKTVRNFKIDGVIDLIPVKLLKSIPSTYDANGIARQAGECGMFDSISGKFYGNVASSGSFTVSDN